MLVVGEADDVQDVPSITKGNECGELAITTPGIVEKRIGEISKLPQRCTKVLFDRLGNGKLSGTRLCRVGEWVLEAVQFVRGEHQRGIGRPRWVIDGLCELLAGDACRVQDDDRVLLDQDVGNFDQGAFPRHVWVVPLLPSDLGTRWVEHWSRIEIGADNEGEDCFPRRVYDSESRDDRLGGIHRVIFEDRYKKIVTIGVNDKVGVSVLLVFYVPATIS